MTPQPLKIRADVEMKCFQFDGVLHIKVLFATLLPSMQVCFPVYELLILFIGSHEES
jgi:translation initiation factor 2 alpha subunit (eIF-2alpha)